MFAPDLLCLSECYSISICVTTALDPQGHSTTWYQPPTGASESTQTIRDKLINPQLLALTPENTLPPSMDFSDHSRAETFTVPRTFGSDVTGIASNSTTYRSVEAKQVARTPKPSSCDSSGVVQDAISKARMSISKVPAKCTMVDALMEIQK